MVHFNSRSCHFKRKNETEINDVVCPVSYWRLDEMKTSDLCWSINQYIELCFWHSKLCYSVLKCDIRTSNKSTAQARWLVYFWGIVRQWTWCPSRSSPSCRWMWSNETSGNREWATTQKLDILYHISIERLRMSIWSDELSLQLCNQRKK